MLTAPYASEYDPSEESEGSIDPLGLAATYERLADRLLPGVTVRMGRPRFLTAIAVGARVCEPWDDDDLAKDGVTPPWLVFEWFVAEALYRSQAEMRDFGGLPGIQKIGRALRDGRPVSAASYLKTPSVFGFTGIFRRLGRRVKLITDEGRLDDAGYELLSAWERDQSLDGFLDGRDGAGADFRENLRRVVAQGMEHGATTRQASDFWVHLARRLNPADAGRHERKALLRLIETRSGPLAMVTHLSKELRRHNKPVLREEEPRFLETMARSAPSEMAQLLGAIEAYESFCRVISEGFVLLQWLASKAGHGRVSADDLSAAAPTSKYVARLAAAIERVRAHPSLLGWESALERTLARFDHVKSSRDLFDSLLDHHQLVQKEKPPNGKRTWFERESKSRAVLRAAYFVDEVFPADGQGFVHEYRIPTFSRFLDDLGAFR